MENNDSNTKKIVSLHFGELTIDKEHIFTFPDGMLGFENLKEYVLISEEETIPFKWLISIDEPEIGFPVLSPWHIDLKYNPGKNFNFDYEVLFVVVTLENQDGNMTANMKAPIILNVEEQNGKQIILPGDRFSANLIIPINKEKGD
jgi:flagellar assembly factor FliW